MPEHDSVHDSHDFGERASASSYWHDVDHGSVVRHMLLVERGGNDLPLELRSSATRALAQEWFLTLPLTDRQKVEDEYWERLRDRIFRDLEQEREDDGSGEFRGPSITKFLGDSRLFESLFDVIVRLLVVAQPSDVEAIRQVLTERLVADRNQFRGKHEDDARNQEWAAAQRCVWRAARILWLEPLRRERWERHRATFHRTDDDPPEQESKAADDVMPKPSP